MNIDKRPSGNYRVRKMVNGKTYTLTLDHKPTEKEIMLMISEKMADAKVYTPSMPFYKACEAYIDAKSNVISPSSIRGYNSIIKQFSEQFANTPIQSVTTPMVQTEVNKYSASHSPKSTANYSGFIVSVLKFYGNDIGKITLPQKDKKSPYIPTENEVKAIFNAVKGSKYEIPILLSGMGLRRSEICALTPSDLNGNLLTINKAKVQNEREEWVIKATKTTDSTRTIELPDYLVKLINERGFYNGHPELIYRKLTQVQSELGIPHFPLHKMRHFFASYLHQLGKYTEKQIQDMGGWKSDRILKTVYTHSMEMEKAKKSAANDMGTLM